MIEYVLHVYWQKLIDKSFGLLQLVLVAEEEVNEGDLHERMGTLRMKMTTERKIANPCMLLRLFHTLLFSCSVIHDPGTKMKKITSITCSAITIPKI